MNRALEIRPLDAARDADSLLATWATVFGRERRRAEWEHQVLANPAGTRVFVATCDGRVVAQYAGVPTRVWIDGAERVFTQSVDSLVHPEFRKGLKRPGLFVDVARAYFDHYGVHGSDAVHYGWPLEAAWRIGKRFLEYECVREEVVLVRNLDAAPAEISAPEFTVEDVVPTGEELRWLWERCCGAWGASAIRDAAFYAWRFAGHADAAYRLLGARDAGGTLCGLAVLRCGDWLTPGSRALCDWLVPRVELAASRQLESAVLRAAEGDGGRRVVTLIPEWSPHFLTLQERGWCVHPAPYRLAARCFDQRLDHLFLREHWWLTLADSDLA
ncbi:MAG: GNAT family N-acetyltransferase [Planctomycetes bacterium]|nr:GNAT family N-acetyltransferase [Planctomycetota bacterium]